MQNKDIKFRIIIVAASLLLANSAYAFDMGNMMVGALTTIFTIYEVVSDNAVKFSPSTRPSCRER